MSTMEELLKQVDDLEKGWNQDITTPPSDVAGANAGNADAMKAAVSSEPASVAQDAGETHDGNEAPPEPARPEGATTEPWARRGYELEQNRKRVPPEDPVVAKMKAVGWAPKTSAPAGGPDWEGMQKQLAAAQSQASTRRDIENLLANDANSGAYRTDPGRFEMEANAAKEPLETAQAKQGYEAKAQGIEANKTKLAEDAADRDPTSPESQRARDSFKAFFKDSPAPENFDSFSADDVKKYATDPLGTLTKIRSEEDLRRFRAAEADKFSRAANAADTANAAKATEAQRLRDSEAASLPIERQALAGDPRIALTKNPTTGKPFSAQELEGLDRKGIEAVRKQFESLKAPKGGGGPAKATHTLEEIPDPGDRALVKQIGEGLSDGSGLDRKQRGRVMSLVAQVYPNYDATKFGAYKGERDKLAKSDEVDSINTAQEHINRARTKIPDQFDSQFLNRVRQMVLTGTGSSSMTDFETDVKVAADEYAKSLGNNAQAGRQEIEHILSPVQSPKQLRSAIDEIDHLLASKRASVARSFRSAAPDGTPLPEKLRGPGDAPIKMKFPNGETHDVAPDEVDLAKKKGGEPL